MANETLETINQAKITVTFYSGSNENNVEDKLSKKYILKNWRDETDLRRLLEELAEEMNHLSGYGIWAIEINSDRLRFVVDYKSRFKLYWSTPSYTPSLNFYRRDAENAEKKHKNLSDLCASAVFDILLTNTKSRFKPYIYESLYHNFWDVLRFEVGRYIRGGRVGSKVRIEIPRIGVAIPYNAPLKKYEPNDRLFHIKIDSVGGKKERSRLETWYRLSFDANNPYLASFLRKISKDGVLFPDTTKEWEHTTLGPRSLSWWKLPESQITLHKRKRNREQEEKRKKQEESKVKQLEKAGIVYKPKKKKEKAYQVYIIGAEDGNLADIYKIGISNAPGKRLQSLNTSNPFKLTIIHKFVAEPAKDAEAQLHTMFQDSRTSGEWFRLTPEQISELKRILEFKEGKFIKS